MKLSRQQVAFFDQFGYLMIRQLFNHLEMAAISRGFDRTLAECCPPCPRRKMAVVLGPIQHVPELNRLLDHPGILGLAGGILGDDFNYACGDGSIFSGEAPCWHAESSWGRLFACKICIYLDPMTRERSALRVIPGSQKTLHPLRGRYAELARLTESYGIGDEDLPGAEVLETSPGDVIIFDHDLYHAAFGEGDKGRMFTLNLTKHCRSSDDMQRLRDYLSAHSPGGYKLNIGGMYFKPLLDSADADRMRHLHQCRAMHDELFPQFKGGMSHGQQIEEMIRCLHPTG